jgi:hypothetical protein
MLHPNPHLMLMGALHFSTDDLYANRRGQLSGAQQKQLEDRRIYQLEACLLGLVLIWSIGVLLGLELLILLFLSAAIGSVMIGLWQRTADDLNEPVTSSTGQLIGVTDSFPGLLSTIQIGEERLRVSREAGSAFLPGHTYRVYMTVASRTLLSAEMLA